MKFWIRILVKYSNRLIRTGIRSSLKERKERERNRTKKKTSILKKKRLKLRKNNLLRSLKKQPSRQVAEVVKIRAMMQGRRKSSLSFTKI
jgi:hypothetical protein